MIVSISLNHLNLGLEDKLNTHWYSINVPTNTAEQNFTTYSSSLPYYLE